MFNWFIPKIFNQGYLPEKNGHRVFFIETGNQKGKPVLVFHGGPGGEARLHYRELFNRKRYRIIFFDQRGCGHSQPVGKTSYNTTSYLLDDVVRLLDFLKIKEKIILLGSSWGSTLALLFAEKYPQRVEALLLKSIFLADKQSMDWSENISGWFYPDIMEKLCQGKKENEKLAVYYQQMINSKNPQIQNKAAALYAHYERVLGCLSPELPEIQMTEKEINEAKIYIHYAASDFMIKPDQIINNLDKISHLPVLIVHNRLDMVCPLSGAFRLHKGLPLSKLVIVPEKGHGGVLISRIFKKEIRLFLKNGY